MKQLLIIALLLTVPVQGCSDNNRKRTSADAASGSSIGLNTAPVFVFTPEFIRTFKQNINTAIGHFSELPTYAQIATTNFFDTANEELKSRPAPYTGPCYFKNKGGGASLRTAARRDAHYARTLALMARIFPDSNEWSFSYGPMGKETHYQYNRQVVLQKAKEYLLAWSQRMAQNNHLIPGITPYLEECPGENKDSARGMEVSMLAYSFVSAYELLFPYLSPNEKEDFKHWISLLKKEIIAGRAFWKAHATNYRGNFNNHLSFQLLGLMSIAVATEDKNLLWNVVAGDQTSIMDSKNLKSMIEGAVFMKQECTPRSYKNNPVCRIFKREIELGSRAKELKKFPKISKMGCQNKHYYPKHILPQSGEIYDRFRRVDKIKGSCAGKGMFYSIAHLEVLTLLSLSAELNGIPMKNFTGSNGETLLSSYRFYAQCLADINKNGYSVSDSVPSCDYYKNNKYPKKHIAIFHLANYLWKLTSPEARRILNKDDQPLNLSNPLDYVLILGLGPITVSSH